MKCRYYSVQGTNLWNSFFHCTSTSTWLLPRAIASHSFFRSKNNIIHVILRLFFFKFLKRKKKIIQNIYIFTIKSPEKFLKRGQGLKIKTWWFWLFCFFFLSLNCSFLLLYMSSNHLLYCLCPLRAPDWYMHPMHFWQKYKTVPWLISPLWEVPVVVSHLFSFTVYARAWW
jgi:hypothetical protein